MTSNASMCSGRDRPDRAGIGRVAAIITVAALVVVVAGMWLWARSGSGAAEAEAAPTAAGTPQWYRVEPRTFPVTVIASGELEAKQKVDVKNEVEGRTTITWVIEEGSAVKKGDVLVRLADDEIKDKIEQAELSLASAKAAKVAAEQDLAIKRSAATSAEESARVKLRMAELELAKWRNGADPQKRRELKLALEKAERRVAREKEDYKASVELYEQRFISRGEHEDDYIAMIEAEAALETAKLEIEVYENYTRPKEEQKAVSDVDQARDELERTVQKNESELEQKEADLASKTRTLKIREDALAKLQSQLEKSVVKAPQDGMVVYGTSVGPSWRRRNPIAQGRQVSFNETLIVLPDTRQMVAALKVHEAKLPVIEVSQPASVEIDARPGEVIEGEVTHISVMAESGSWWNRDLREYEVKVDLPPEVEGKLRPAMRCSGEILVGKVEDALAVPVQAVFTEGQRHFVYVPAPTAGKVRRQVIEVDRASETLVEVVEGLEAGDRVLLRAPGPAEIEGAGPAEQPADASAPAA